MLMVTVKLFGTLRLESGVKELTAEAETVKALYPTVMREIRAVKPNSAITEKALRGCLIAVNGVQTGPRTKLRDGDVVYFFPAVAGG